MLEDTESGARLMPITTLFNTLRSTSGPAAAAVVPLARATLEHLTLTLEDLVLERNVPALVCLGREPTRRLRRDPVRLNGLIERAAFVVAFDDAEPDRGDPQGLLVAAPSRGDQTVDEWFLLVLSYAFSVVLCARPRHGEAQIGGDRTFEAIWSFEPDLVTNGLDWLIDRLAERDDGAALSAVQSVRGVLRPLATNTSALAQFATEMIRFEEQLHQELARVEHERTRVYEREALLSTIARAFIDLPADQLDIAVDAALLAVGQFSGADRCFLIERTPGGDSLEVSYQWFAPDVDDLRLRYPIAQPHALLVSENGPFEPILISDISDLPAGEPLRGELLGQSVHSLAAIPMVYREALQGYVALASGKPRAWMEEDVYLLETLMEIVVAALEHRRVERALGETESLLQRVIYATNHMVYVYSILKNGTIAQMYSSSNIEHLLGYPSALKMANWDFWTSLILPADRPLARAQLERLTRGEDSEAEYRMLHADGRIVWVRDSARCEPGSGDIQWICYGVISDITDRHAAEQALRDRERLQIALEAERKVGEVRNRFMLVVSHEFRTPLSIILTSSEMLDRYHDRMDNDRRKERLGIIRTQVQHLRAMLDEISIVVRAELGRLDFRPAPADVAEFTRKISSEMSTTVGTLHHIDVQVHPDTLWAAVDTSLLRHVLTNLLSNAIKFSDERADIDLHVWIDDRSRPPEIVFEVLDEGIGLDPTELEHLFEPFFRGRNVGAISGTGLGLKVVRDCLARHGGSVVAEPRAVRGSRFEARIPYVPASPTDLPEDENAAIEPGDSGVTLAG